MTDATVEQQGESKRRGEHPEVLKPLTAVAAAVEAQPTLKWAWWMYVRFSVTFPRQLNEKG